MKKIISVFLSLAVLAAAVLVCGGEIRKRNKEKSMNTEELLLRYDEPASVTSKVDTWQRATLPMGNGILGANIYGEIKDDLISLNEETLWSGGRNANDPSFNYTGGNPDGDMTEVYNKISSAILKGEDYDIEELRGTWDGYGRGYQPVGDITFDFGLSANPVPADYMRQLNFSKGTADISFTADGVKYERQYFVSNPDNVVVCRFTADGGDINFTLGFNSKQPAEIKTTASENEGILEVFGEVENNGLKHNTQILVKAQSGDVKAEGETLKVENGNNITIFVSSATDYANKFYNEDKSISFYYRTGESAEDLSSRVRATVENAAKKTYLNLLEAHVADYSNLYGRVELNLGQSSGKMTDDLLSAYKSGTAKDNEKRYLEALMFQYGRYLLISSSRENSQLPNNLQGIWNDNNDAPWCSDIHININEQMNYWLSGNCNLSECALPLVRYIPTLDIPGGITAKKFTGTDHGIMAHNQNTPFGWTGTGWVISTWGWSPAAGTWMMQNCYDYYEFSEDKETLKNVIYPMLKDQAFMYEDLLVEHDGRLVMPISLSPELNVISAGNTYEQSLIWQLFSDTIEAGKILGEKQELLDKWTAIKDKLNPVEIGDSGQVKEWHEETEINSVANTKSHRHLSNLLGLYPGTIFDNEEFINAAKVSLLNKNFGHTGTAANPEGGWTYAQLICSYARVKDGENAYFSIDRMLRNRLYKNLFDYHKYGEHGAFQIDANFGYSAGLAEMLIQSHLGYVELLPALPDEWSSGSVKGLKAEGDFEFDMVWTDKALTEVTVKAEKGGVCAIVLPEGRSFTLQYKGAKPDNSSNENGILTLNMDKNDEVKIIFS